MGEGYVDEVKVKENGTQRIRALGAIDRLRKENFIGSYDGVPAKDVIEDIFEKANVNYGYGNTGDFSSGGDQRLENESEPDLDSPEGGDRRLEEEESNLNEDRIGPSNFSSLIVHDYHGIKCLEALESITGLLNLNWFVDNRNKIWVVKDLYDDGRLGPKFKQGDNVGDIISSSDGLTGNPFKKVIVHGGLKPTRDNEGRLSQPVSRNPPSAYAQYKDFDPQKDEVFEKNELSCITAEYCKKYAVRTLIELSRIQNSGTIEISGDASYQPFDYITLDHSELNNGEDSAKSEKSEYLVSGVEQKVTVDMGFRTTLHLSPLIRFSEDIEIGVIQSGNNKNVNSDDEKSNDPNPTP
jgi:hypothetical protein